LANKTKNIFLEGWFTTAVKNTHFTRHTTTDFQKLAAWRRRHRNNM